MKEIEKAFLQKRIPKLLEALKKKQYDPYFFESAAEAKEFILDQVGSGETIGLGGSITLREDLAMVEDLRKRGNEVYDHWEKRGNRKERLEIVRKQRQASTFISSVNAITTDGVLVCLDGGGNRVAGLCSGPKRVIVVTGLNKLVDSIDEAVHRTRNSAAVMRAIAGNTNTPCVHTGVCVDCDSTERICAALLMLLKKPSYIDHFVVILVGEEMGY